MIEHLFPPDAGTTGTCLSPSKPGSVRSQEGTSAVNRPEALCGSFLPEVCGLENFTVRSVNNESSKSSGCTLGLGEWGSPGPLALSADAKALSGSVCQLVPTRGSTVLSPTSGDLLDASDYKSYL